MEETRKEKKYIRRGQQLVKRKTNSYMCDDLHRNVLIRVLKMCGDGCLFDVIP